jgi:hypothetical protein
VVIPQYVVVSQPHVAVSATAVWGGVLCLVHESVLFHCHTDFIGPDCVVLHIGGCAFFAPYVLPEQAKQQKWRK